MSAYTEVKLEDVPRLIKISETDCPDGWMCRPRQTWPKSWANKNGPVVLLERNLNGHPLDGWIVLGTTKRRSFVTNWMGEITELGMYVGSLKTRVLFFSTCG